MRFIVFLEHGYDDWGRVENPHSCFHPDMLSDEQIQRLADVVGDHIGEQYRIPIATRWRQLS
jgi:hypothetical protein